MSERPLSYYKARFERFVRENLRSLGLLALLGKRFGIEWDARDDGTYGPSERPTVMHLDRDGFMVARPLHSLWAAYMEGVRDGRPSMRDEAEAVSERYAERLKQSIIMDLAKFDAETQAELRRQRADIERSGRGFLDAIGKMMDILVR